jgi:hypothetical protein
MKMLIVGLDDRSRVLNGVEVAGREPEAIEGVGGIDEGAAGEEPEGVGRRGLGRMDRKRRMKENIWRRRVESYLYVQARGAGIHRAGS